MRRGPRLRPLPAVRDVHQQRVRVGGGCGTLRPSDLPEPALWLRYRLGRVRPMAGLRHMRRRTILRGCGVPPVRRHLLPFRRRGRVPADVLLAGRGQLHGVFVPHERSRVGERGQRMRRSGRLRDLRRGRRRNRRVRGLTGTRPQAGPSELAVHERLQLRPGDEVQRDGGRGEDNRRPTIRRSDCGSVINHTVRRLVPARCSRVALLVGAGLASPLRTDNEPYGEDNSSHEQEGDNDERGEEDVRKGVKFVT